MWILNVLLCSIMIDFDDGPSFNNGPVLNAQLLIAISLIDDLNMIIELKQLPMTQLKL